MVSLMIVFGVGGISIIASIVRFSIIEQRLVNKIFNWDTMHLYCLWSHAEVTFGIIAFSLPVFRYILLDTVGKISSYLGLSSTDSNTPLHAPPTVGSAGKVRRMFKDGKLSLTESLFTDDTLRGNESQVELKDSKAEQCGSGRY